MKIKHLAFAFGISCTAFSATGADLFSAEGTVTGNTTESRSVKFDSAEDMLDAPKFENLHRYFTNYTGHEQADLHMNFRGLGMDVAYPIANDSLLVFSVPSLHISEHFNGADREESQRQFSDFFKKNGGHLLSEIHKKLAEVSPNDPIAGNPNSMMSQMAANDFDNGFNVGSSIGIKEEGQSSNNLIGIGARLTSLRNGGISNSNFTIPFSYTVRSDIDPRRQLIFNLPVSYSKVDDAKSYNVGLGTAYRIPMNDNWTLTPSVSYNAVSARDLGSYAQAVGSSITSSYVFEGKGYNVVVGNMVGYYKTLKLSAGGYSYDPGIHNVVFRNGVMYSQPITLSGKKMSIEYSLIDTRFRGTRLYNRGYDEIGITIGTNKNAMSARSYLRAGASYIFAPHSKGFTLNIGYWF